MPHAAPTRCTHRHPDGRSCAALSTVRGRCDDHQPPPWQRRSKAWGAGGTRQWRALRDKQLRDNPSCARCDDEATEVDHKLPLSQGGAKFDRANLQSLCVSCHEAKTRSEQR